MNGLILAGGQSSRMGQPKSLISYHGKPQYQHTAELLSPYCERVFISCREEQKLWFEGYETIPDSAKYGDIGLLNGVLSAFEVSHLESSPTSWFILGCDYPLLESNDLEQLFQSRNLDGVATVFYHPDTQFIEPLVAIFEPKAGPLLSHWLESGNESLRRFLENQEVQRVLPLHPERLKSIDTPEERRKILEF